VKGCSNAWARLCRICCFQICQDHLVPVKYSEIPNDHWRCPACQKLSVDESLMVWSSPDVQQRRKIFVGRMFLLIQEQTSGEQWNWLMEELPLAHAGIAALFKDAMRFAISNAGQYALRHYYEEQCNGPGTPTDTNDSSSPNTESDGF